MMMMDAEKPARTYMARNPCWANGVVDLSWRRHVANHPAYGRLHVTQLLVERKRKLLVAFCRRLQD